MSDLEIADVLAFAAEQRRWRARIVNPESSSYVPFAAPSAPSDKRARNLCAEKGPAGAMAYLQLRAEANERDVKRQIKDDADRLVRERGRRRGEERDRQEMLTGVTPGARVDRALTDLRCIATGKASNLDRDRSTGKPSSVLLFDDGSDPVAPAVQKALRCARDLEAQVERLKRRQLPPPTMRNRDERLRGMHGYSPEQVAQADPEQGLPRQIRDRRSALSLDEETGDQILRAA